MKTLFSHIGQYRGISCLGSVISNLQPVSLAWFDRKRSIAEDVIM